MILKCSWRDQKQILPNSNTSLDMSLNWPLVCLFSLCEQSHSFISFKWNYSCQKSKCVTLSFETDKWIYILLTDKTKFQNSSSALIHNYVAVSNFFGFYWENHFKTVSQKLVNEKTVSLHKQCYLIETCIGKHKLLWRNSFFMNCT